ncbi:MAG: hypothetical protein IKR25_03565 [Muribaculaceae bacterium]|nr:hypothetical protein [Muribaculaceae bacterium]
MKPGKHICETLKGIRAEIARANDIDYAPTECTHEGDCAGTCPACESEVRWLERQLRLRQRLGKAVTIAGLSIGITAAATSCNLVRGKMPGPVEGEIPNPNYVDTTEMELDGDVMMMPDSSEACNVEKSDTAQLVQPANVKPEPRPNKRTAGAVPMHKRKNKNGKQKRPL